MTIEDVKSFLDYDQNTGIFIRKVHRNHKARVGQVAGYTQNGYRIIKINSKPYYAHRLAWLLIKGVWPVGALDHINGDRLDNRVGNLREATPKENGQNKAASKGSSSKYVGVSWHKASGKWGAYIKVNRKAKHLGLFSNEVDAALAYLNAKAILHTFNPEVRGNLDARDQCKDVAR